MESQSLRSTFGKGNIVPSRVTASWAIVTRSGRSPAVARSRYAPAPTGFLHLGHVAADDTPPGTFARYALTDRATWLHFPDRRDLKIVVENDRSLFNQYAVILVNPARHPQVKAELGMAFIDWASGNCEFA